MSILGNIDSITDLELWLCKVRQYWKNNDEVLTILVNIGTSIDITRIDSTSIDGTSIDITSFDSSSIDITCIERTTDSCKLCLS